MIMQKMEIELNLVIQLMDNKMGLGNFFYENGKPSMENIYKNGKFIETIQRWDKDGNLLKNDD